MNSLPDTLKPGDEIEVQIAPHGSFPGSVMQDGKRRDITQRLEPADIDRLVAACNPQAEILVDRDHASDAPGGSTEAMAWIHGLRHDPERGLVGILRPTDIGAEALANRRYRFLSPVIEITLDGDTAIPVSLLSVALTNQPNLPVACVLNRAPAANSTVPVEDHQRNIMDKLRELLGLEAEAGDDAILAAVTALKTASDEAAAAKVKAEAEAFADANADKIANRDAVVRLYIENRDAVQAAMAAIKAPPPPARVTNSAGAQRPAAGAKPDVLATYNSLFGRERRAYLREHAAEIEAARREAAK
jgi:phage I-like protein